MTLEQRIACRWMTATKTQGEREDEEAERMVRPSPKNKPPRSDLERGQVKDKDTNEKDPDKAQDEQDRTHNYKKIALRLARIRMAAEKHKPNDIWQTEDGGWAATNSKGTVHGFGDDREAAEAYKNDEGPPPDDDPNDPNSDVNQPPTKEDPFDPNSKVNRGRSSAPPEKKVQNQPPKGKTHEEKDSPAKEPEKRVDPFQTSDGRSELNQLVRRIEADSILETLAPGAAALVDEKAEGAPISELDPIDVAVVGQSIARRMEFTSDKPEDRIKELAEEFEWGPSEVKKFNNAIKAFKAGKGMPAIILESPSGEYVQVGADPKNAFNDPLLVAAVLGKPAVVKILEHDAEFNHEGAENAKQAVEAVDAAGDRGVNHVIEELKPRARIEFNDALSKSIRFAEQDARKALEDSDVAKRFSKALNDARVFFEDPPSPMDPKEAARHVATMAANATILAKDTAKYEKVLKDTIGSLRSVRDVSIDRDTFENLSTKDLKEISDVLTSTAEQVDADATAALTDEEASKAFEARIKEATEFFEDDSKDKPAAETAKHLATLAARERILRAPIEKALKDGKKIFSNGNGIEQARDARSAFDDLSGPGKIQFLNGYNEEMASAKKQVAAHLDGTASQTAKKSWENKVRAAKAFFQEDRDDEHAADPKELATHTAVLHANVKLDDPLIQAGIPDTPESKEPIIDDPKADEAAFREASKKAESAFSKYRGSPELRESHEKKIQKELDALPEGSPRRIQLEGMQRGMTLAKIIDDGDNAKGVSPAFAALVKIAHKTGDLDFFLNVHEVASSKDELRTKAQHRVNQMLKKVSDDDWPDMIGQNHPLHELAMALTDPKVGMGESSRQMIREQLQDSMRGGIVILDPRISAENPEGTVGENRKRAEDMLRSAIAEDSNTERALKEAAANPSSKNLSRINAWFAKLMAKLSSIGSQRGKVRGRVASMDLFAAWYSMEKRIAIKYANAQRMAAVPDKYSGIDFKPPKTVADAASTGLEYRQKASPSNKGGLTPAEAGKQGIGSGVQRAVNLKNRNNASPEVIRQMVSFFARHEKNKSISSENKDTPWNDKGYVAWLIWGSDPGKAWAEKIRDQMDKADAVKKASLGLRIGL